MFESLRSSSPALSPVTGVSTLRRLALTGLAGSVLALSAMAASIANASDTPICGPRATIVQQLSFGYGETSSAFGTTANGMVAELFISKEGSWTMVVTRPDGVSCLMAAGKDWGASTSRKPKADAAQQS